jgi:hypothetical protein
MRALPPIPLLLAAIQLATLTAPSLASAQAAGNPTTAQPSAASKGLTVLGIVLVPLGVVAMLYGAAVVALGALTQNGGSDPSAPTSNTGAVPGGTAIALGALAVIGGIVLIATNSTSASTPVTPPPVRVQTGLLVPTWRDVKPEERALPPAVGLPLWTGRF